MGAVVVTFFKLTCSVVLWGGRNTANKYHWHVLTVIQPHWICPCSWRVCFPSLHCSGCRLLCWELSDAGPGFCVHPRSKPLRFRFLGTPQRCRIGWACVLCPSQVQLRWPGAWWAQSPPVEGCDLSLPPSQLPGFLGVQQAHFLRCAMCLFWGADLWLRPSGQMSMVQNSKKSWLATKSASVWYRMLLWGPRLPSSGCPPLPVFSGGWAGPQPASSAQSFVLWVGLAVS